MEPVIIINIVYYNLSCAYKNLNYHKVVNVSVSIESPVQVQIFVSIIMVNGYANPDKCLDQKCLL